MADAARGRAGDGTYLPVMTTAFCGSEITPGVTFRSVIADSNALWEVTGRESGRSWRCTVIPEPEPVMIGGVAFYGDYVGTERIFTDEQIAQRMRAAATFTRLAREAEDAWAALQVADTVHYDNGHGCFVRCEIVTEAGEKTLLPVALVGNWGVHELRGLVADDATVRYRTYAQKIIDGGTFKPGVQSLVESSVYRRSPAVDPATLPALEIFTPQVTDDDRVFAALYAAVKDAEQALTARGDGSKAERIRAARQRLTDALA